MRRPCATPPPRASSGGASLHNTPASGVVREVLAQHPALPSLAATERSRFSGGAAIAGGGVGREHPISGVARGVAQPRLAGSRWAVVGGDGTKPILGQPRHSDRGVAGVLHGATPRFGHGPRRRGTPLFRSSLGSRAEGLRGCFAATPPTWPSLAAMERSRFSGGAAMAGGGVPPQHPILGVARSVADWCHFGPRSALGWRAGRALPAQHPRSTAPGRDGTNPISR